MVDPVFFTQGIVAILNSKREICGTGFLVADRLIATCAHVVEAAGSRPGETLQFQFHGQDTILTATVSNEFWDKARDVAFLSLPKDISIGKQLLRLGVGQSASDNLVKCFGYPALNTKGLWAEGTVRGLIQDEQNRELVQIDSGELTSGFSGAPVWDVKSGLIIGMATAIAHPDRYGRLGRVAFATPAEVIHAICNDIPIIAAPSQLPPARTTYFVDRGPLMDDLRTALQSGKHGTILGVYGMGGVGKTELVLRLARELEIESPGSTMWIHIGERPLDSIQTEMAQALSLELPSGLEPDIRSRVIKEALEHNPKTVFLHEVHPSFSRNINSIKPAESRVVLTTSQGENLPGIPPGAMHHLNVLTSKQAIELLQNTPGLKEAVKADMEGALALAEVTGFHPFALEHIARQLATHMLNLKDSPQLYKAENLISTFTKRLQERLAQVYQNDNSLTDLEAIFEISYQGLIEIEQKQFLELTSFSPTGFNPNAAAALWGIEDWYALEIIQRLERASLIQHAYTSVADTSRFQLHPLLYDFAKKKLSKQGKVHNQSVIPERLIGYFKQFAQNHTRDYVAIFQEWVNISTALQAAWENANKRNFIDIVLALRHFYYEYGFWEEGEQRLSEALLVNKSVEDKNAQAKLEMVLGVIKYHRGNFVEARHHLEDSLSLVNFLLEGRSKDD